MLLLVEETYFTKVAPLAGSVDRNAASARGDAFDMSSLPSRGAWIEMFHLAFVVRGVSVAPLAGSVDRNYDHGKYPFVFDGRSPRGERG